MPNRKGNLAMKTEFMQKLRADPRNNKKGHGREAQRNQRAQSPTETQLTAHFTSRTSRSSGWAVKGHTAHEPFIMCLCYHCLLLSLCRRLALRIKSDTAQPARELCIITRRRNSKNGQDWPARAARGKISRTLT